MNLLRKWFGDRRAEDTNGIKVGIDRRGSLLKRHEEATKKLEQAVADLNETLSMPHDEFRELLRKEAGEPLISEVIQFDTFAAICEFRYSPRDSLMRLCKHKDHDAHSTGVAACREALCPLMLKAMKKK